VNNSWLIVAISSQIAGFPLPRTIDLAIDKNNVLHVSYISSDGITYGTNYGGDWSIYPVGAGFYNSIDVDNDNLPHIVFSDLGKHTMMYARKDIIGKWETQILENEFNGYNSIAIDKKGVPHVVYQNMSSTQRVLRYAKLEQSTWTIYTIESVNAVVDFAPCIKIDKNDSPNIVYYRGRNIGLKYMKWRGTTWYIETVDNQDSTGLHLWLALDKHDVPHISYYDATLKCLKVAKKVGDGWYIVVVDSSADVGQYSSIDIDMDGVIHISYFDNTNKDLKYAKLVNTNPELSWTGEENYVSGGVYPTVGDRSTTFVFRIRYTDIDNDPPKPGYPRVRIKKDGVEISSPFIMLEVDPSDTVYSDGKLYISSITLPAGRYSYSFEAYDIWDAIATGSPTTFFDGPYVNEPGIVVVNKGEVKVVGGTSGKGTVNPEKGEKVEIFFKGEQVGKYVCEIFTINGVLVYEDTKDNITEGKFEWLPKDIATGTYLVYIEGPGIKYKKKVVILR